MNHLPVQYLIGGTEKLSDAAWALNAKTDAEDETLWLPLVVHLQDTAAVMEYLLWHWLPDDYDDELELTQEKLCKIAIAAALLHDIGKATPMFQRKILQNRRRAYLMKSCFMLLQVRKYCERKKSMNVWLL